jgi:hypothetical protein
MSTVEMFSTTRYPPSKTFSKAARRENDSDAVIHDFDHCDGPGAHVGHSRIFRRKSAFDSAAVLFG